jgi:cytochrome c556
MQPERYCASHLGIHSIKRVLSVNEASQAALLLHFCNGVHRQRGLAAALWTKDLQFRARTQHFCEFQKRLQQLLQELTAVQKKVVQKDGAGAATCHAKEHSLQQAVLALAHCTD